ncbi:MAG: DUF1045 domain-containing protein [Deltaproteobacteria bacterium]|nr:DUF1045 domain-containing protein [Candidatus Anaeroferrophillus wilburensis]MBN2890181.1 DUF1045 domain-containing protein [Deltaproteobacteria bacterium]
MKQSSTTLPRYAIYFTPAPASPLALFGRQWLGRDNNCLEETEQFQVPGLPRERFHALTASPRRYGFHATLKAPFYLAAGRTESQIQEALVLFAADCHSILLSPLQISLISSFFCLMPSSASAELMRLARDVVQKFDSFRTPPSTAEVQRRSAANLSPIQEYYTRMWGYPYVLDEYRFHLTLTDKVRDPQERELLRAALKRLLSTDDLRETMVDSLTLLRQDCPEKPFLLLQRIPLGR